MKKLVILIIITISLLVSAPVHALDFESIRNNMNSMTSLQWDDYTSSLGGRSISWTGWINDVKKQWFGGCKVLIDMDNSDSFSVRNIYIGGVPQSLAYHLYKNQKVSFTGTITSIMNLLGSCAVNINYTKIE